MQHMKLLLLFTLSGLTAGAQTIDSGLKFLDTPYRNTIETGFYFTFPNGHTITCDSLYLVFQRVSDYENKLDSLIKVMRGPKTGPRYSINEAVHWYDSLHFAIPVPPGTVGWQKDCDTCKIIFFGFYPG